MKALICQNGTVLHRVDMNLLQTRLCTQGSCVFVFIGRRRDGRLLEGHVSAPAVAASVEPFFPGLRTYLQVRIKRGLEKIRNDRFSQIYFLSLVVCMCTSTLFSRK